MKTLEQARKAVEDRTLEAERRIKERREARLGLIQAPTSTKVRDMPSKGSSKR